MLPQIEEIKQWTDEKLQFVVKSGESIYWNCKLDEETDEEFDLYVYLLYSEMENRNLKLFL